MPLALFLALFLGFFGASSRAAYGEQCSSTLHSAAAAAANRRRCFAACPVPCSLPRRPVPASLLLLRLGAIPAAGLQRPAATVHRAGGPGGRECVPVHAPAMLRPLPPPLHASARRPTMMRPQSSPRQPSWPCSTPWGATTAMAARCPGHGAAEQLHVTCWSASPRCC